MRGKGMAGESIIIARSASERGFQPRSLALRVLIAARTRGRSSAAAALILASTLLTGCQATFGPNAVNGITFYCPGAGNLDFGDAGVREGLREAGYRGEVASFLWTVAFNPAIDQALRINARLAGTTLSSTIRQYVDRYPGKPVNLVGLSAGTGIALWALEDLPPGYQVDNVVLLSGSIYYRRDISKALPHIKGKIYNYYSSNDIILAGPMKIFGTIDGVFGEDGAGAVGLSPPSGKDRVVNISWRPEFASYGYVGGHVDSTRAPFIRQFVSKHILETPSIARETTPARSPVKAFQAAASR
ncbi:MAG: hypothetical protein U1D55_13250 [Phycisphaerae bacterium]